MTTASPDHAARDRRIAAALVIAQFVLLGVVLLLPPGSAWTLPTWAVVACGALALAGLAVLAVGGLALGRGLTALPLPNDAAQLRTSGPYRFVRHPIYTGLLALALARTLTSGNPGTVVAFVLLVALLTVKARFEERHLAARFDGYHAYAARTPRFVPGARRPRA